MNNKLSFLYYVCVAAMTLVLMVVVPQAIDQATYTPQRYPFAAYSHIWGHIGWIDMQQKDTYPLTDKYGNKYTTHDYDSIFPLLNYAQLMMDGRMPDSIMGEDATMKNIRSKFIVKIYKPGDDGRSPSGLHLMYESMPVRVGIEVPNDVMFIADNIRFSDDVSNEDKDVKSKMFTNAMQHAGCKFPILNLWGNDNPRKKYDEGFFCLDADSSIYHLKMVNGRPFVRSVPMPEHFRPILMLPMEPSDKSLYGLLFSSDGRAGLLSAADETTYSLQLFEAQKIDTRKDKVKLSGDMVSWLLNITNDRGVQSYAYDRNTFALLDTASIPVMDKTTAEKIGATLCTPCIRTTANRDGGEHLSCELGSLAACFVNIILSSLFFAATGRNRGKRGIGETIFILVTGISGLLSIIFVPRI